MIPKQELRLGNKVMHDNRLFEVSILSDEYPFLNTAEFGVGVVDYNNIYPIPLTEDWLIRFGFIQISALEFRNKKRLIMKRGNDYYDYGTDVHIEYVHQLQNFYYALTQTELTTK